MIDEGTARSLVSKIQKLRKTAKLVVEDVVTVSFDRKIRTERKGARNSGALCILIIMLIPRCQVWYEILQDDAATRLGEVLKSQAEYLAQALNGQELTPV